MDRRRTSAKPSSTSAVPPPAQASDAFYIPLHLTNKFFFALFFVSAYYLMGRWREKIRTSTPLHVLNLSEIVLIFALLASIIYLLGFFGIDFVQTFISRPDDFIPAPAGDVPPPAPPKITGEDADIVADVVSGAVPSYSLEARLGDCRRAASIRRQAVEVTAGQSLDGLPLDGFDYDSILGQCCEMPVGYVQIPVGIAGPLVLDGRELSVPMATTEGCLVASTNRGCKAIALSGGASSVLLRDGMTRAPVVRFGSAKRAAALKFFLEDPMNFENLSVVFNRFAF